MKARLVVEYEYPSDVPVSVYAVANTLARDAAEGRVRPALWDTWTLTVDHEGVSETVTSDDWREVCG